MTNTRFITLGALALLAAASASVRAQTTQVQLAFGYTCGDRFVVRNEGSNPVVVEYAVAGSQDKSTLHLNARQSAEIASAQEGNVELWVGGKVVASEAKGHRACGAPRNARANSNDVTVRPINPDAEMTTTAPADSAYTEPAVVVVAPRPYYYDSYYGYPYYPYYSYGFYGYSPYYYPSVGVRVGFGGFGRGFGRGGRGRR
jgi:hypothetical protein